jgi:hypothetical protein
MTRTTRRIIDFIATSMVIVLLMNVGAGWWALVVIPYGLWNYYDGAMITVDRLNERIEEMLSKEHP